MINLIRQFTVNKWGVKTPDVKFGFLSRVGEGATFEGHNRIGRQSSIWGRVGKYSYLGDRCLFMGKIGRFTSISSNVRTINGRHAFKAPFVSTCPLFFSNQNLFGKKWVEDNLFDEYTFADKEHHFPVIVGNDCWIGYGASIIEGVTVRDGAVVLANATVTKDVPPYAIVGGVPAKIVGYRYDEEKIKRLIEMKWWDRTEEWILENIQNYSNIDEFVKLI